MPSNSDRTRIWRRRFTGCNTRTHTLQEQCSLPRTCLKLTETCIPRTLKTAVQPDFPRTRKRSSQEKHRRKFGPGHENVPQVRSHKHTHTHGQSHTDTHIQTNWEYRSYHISSTSLPVFSVSLTTAQLLKILLISITDITRLPTLWNQK